MQIAHWITKFCEVYIQNKAFCPLPSCRKITYAAGNCLTFEVKNRKCTLLTIIANSSSSVPFSDTSKDRQNHMDRVKRICVFEHSVMTNLTAHAQPLRGSRDMAFCLKVPLDSLLVWASSGSSGETARMRRLAWTFAARIGDKYQIRLTRPIFHHCSHCFWNGHFKKASTHFSIYKIIQSPIFNGKQENWWNIKTNSKEWNKFSLSIWPCL